MFLPNYERFQKAVAREATRVVRRRMEADPYFEQRMKASLAGGPLPPPAQPESPSEKFHLALLRGFSEIASSWDGLLELAQLVRRNPPRRSGLSKVFYLRFLIEGYLQEGYICSKRLEAFATRLQRLYAKDEPKRAAVLGVLRKATTQALKPLVSMRGVYVHSTRKFDQDIENLSTFELIAGQTGDDGDLLRFYRGVRMVKFWWMTGKNLEIRKVVDLYFEQLYKLLFHKNGRIRVPASYRAR